MPRVGGGGHGTARKKAGQALRSGRGWRPIQKQSALDCGPKSSGPVTNAVQSVQSLDHPQQRARWIVLRVHELHRLDAHDETSIDV